MEIGLLSSGWLSYFLAVNIVVILRDVRAIFLSKEKNSTL